MYADPNLELDSPPPRSQFRRPWSPGPDDGVWRNVHLNTLSDQGHSQSLQGMSSGRRQRREASDVSVEALDLADYARTLRTRQAEDPYPPFPSHIAQPHPPSASPYIPQLATSGDSIAMHPPSLISRGTTTSSLGTHITTSSSPPSHARRVTRRPYSLPPTTSSQPTGLVLSGRNPHRNPHQSHDPYIVDPDIHPSADEIDISNFPKWSRGWYNSHNSRHSHHEPQLDDIYTPIPASLVGSSKNKSNVNIGYNYDPYSPYDVPPPFSSVGHESSRNLLPWSMDPPEYGPPLNPILKEERMRMLEREFGGLGKKGKKGIDDDGQPMVGSVDEKGNLVTSGPKRRIFLRVLEIVLAAGACVPAIYASLVIKPVDPSDPPPSANKPPIFVLYVLSSLTLISLLYLFLIRPCCIVRKPVSTKNPGLTNTGMMILPVTGLGGKKGGKAKKKGKRHQGTGQGPGDVQVNLIVDPEAFRPPDEDSPDDDEEGSLDEGSQMIPGAFGYEERERRKKKRRNRRRRGLVEGLRMEEQWKMARSWAKKLTAVDVVGLVLWGAAFVFIMLGQRCPSGGYNGWCNAYNVSTASACLLAIAFGVSLFYDVQDLHASKQSPRTRN